jgi:hypothetical protein
MEVDDATLPRRWSALSAAADGARASSTPGAGARGATGGRSASGATDAARLLARAAAR